MAPDVATSSSLDVGWEYLLAHHLPNRYDRTIPATVGSRTLHFCARCSGEVVGFLAFLLPFLWLPAWAVGISVPPVGLLLAAGPAAAEVDWLTQTIHGRESTNRIRFVTGLLVGVAVGGLVGFGVTGRWTFFESAVVVLVGYVAAASLALSRTGAWRRVVAEHFP